MNWVLLWLLLHIAAATIAFGPTFVFPLMEPTLKGRPAGIGFAVLLSEKRERGLIITVALTMVVSGIGLIVAQNLNFFGKPVAGGRDRPLPHRARYRRAEPGPGNGQAGRAGRAAPPRAPRSVR